MACQVPVFRYALERWSPDDYRIFVISDQQLTAQQEDLVKQLNEDV